MHIGAWQEYRLYKILVLRENYRKNGLQQLSAQPSGLVQKKDSFSDAPSAPSRASTAKTTVSARRRPPTSRSNATPKAQHTATSRASLGRRDSAGTADTPSSVLKRDYEQWQKYDSAKERATKAFSLNEFAPPPVPRVHRPPLPTGKSNKNVSATQTQKQRIDRMRAMYGIKARCDQGAKLLPPLTERRTDKESAQARPKILKETERRFDSECVSVAAVPQKQGAEIQEERHVDEKEVDGLLQWAQGLPEELSSSMGIRVPSGKDAGRQAGPKV